MPLPGRLVCRHELRKRIIRSAGPTRSARKLEVPGIVGMAKTTRTLVREFSASPRDRAPQASAASARSAVRQNGGTKKDLSFSSKDRSLTCGATFTIDSSDAEPSHEHANTCSALNAGSRSRYSVGSAPCAPCLPFPFPSANHLPSSLLRESQLRPLSVSAHDGLTFASSVSAIKLWRIL